MTQTPPTETLLEAARQAVLRASRVVREARERVVAMGSFSKSDASPVTVADMAGQAVVSRTLTQMLGPVTLVGEETAEPLRGPRNDAAMELALRIVAPAWQGATASALLDAIDAGGDKAGAQQESFWTLDPIDGTKGFLRPPVGHYCCCLAYIHKGRPIVGVLGCPTMDLDESRPVDSPDASGLLMWATAGGGAMMSALETGATAMPARSAVWREDSSAVRVAMSVEADWAGADRVLPVLKAAGLEPKLERLDGQCKYAMVALGRSDLFLRLPKRRHTPDYIWDHAAGELIIRESGAKMTDTHGLALDFGVGKSLDRNAGFLAAAEPLHRRLLGLLRSGEW